MAKASSQVRIESRFQKLCDDTQAMSIQGYRADGTVVYWNKASEKIYGYTCEEALGQSLFDLIIPEEMREDVEQAVAWMFANHKGLPPERLSLKHKNGSTVPVYSSHTVVALPGDEPIMFCMDADLRALESAEEKVQQLSYFDPLTGLPNRRLFLEHLTAVGTSAKFESSYGALLLVDIEKFHSINDSLGYDAGDQVLTHSAKVFSKLLRAHDSVARLGADEFAFVLPQLATQANTAATYAEEFAHQISDALATPIELRGEYHRVRVNIGITVFDSCDVENCHHIMRQADIALKSVKADNDSFIAFFDQQMEAALRQRLLLSQALNSAIEAGQLKLAFQTQVNRFSHSIGAEALLRWHHPEYGEITPSEFIPIAEATGAIIPIGEWVLRRCCERLKRWENMPDYKHLRISVNVSPVQFLRPDFVARVEQVLRETGAPVYNLRLELTESLMAGSIEFIIQQMKRIRELGVSISLDDFGTGYASLAYLSQLPLDELKIDRAFVHDLNTNGKSTMLAETIISLGRSLNLAVVAEGVETEQQFERLQDLGCEFFQGFLFSKPRTDFD
ncbi:GGDEF domain-containing phosphodiesterase [Pseudidiomarina insulisalsae]|uniref:GGDEF domain-containing protein n=1 Tax=Pseudidiomarina insulisalsae TaxID=575789 RepID=A0A432YQE5_9GAMM|nr:GGDEF domain-containing phosphodiesterase [Pseudidiomarina insulisalsae]RUO63631.1 hypothetical protein CWI71_00770 [Pseudidiomarina insulisalsae]